MPATTLLSRAWRWRRARIWILSWRSWWFPSVRERNFQNCRKCSSARRRQLTFDGLRIMRETLGDAARHLADIDFFLAGLESIEDLRRRIGRRHLRDRQHRGHPGVDRAGHRGGDTDALRRQFAA